jgi:hypothetical protein
MPLTFVYQLPSPSATISAPVATSSTAATLSGVAGDGGQGAAGGGNSTWTFQYGTDPAFGSFTSTGNTYFTGTAATASVGVSGLTSGTRYYCRLSVTNSTGTVVSPVISFETVVSVPQLLGPLVLVWTGPGGVTFSWTYNPGDASGGQTGYSLKLTGSVPTLGSERGTGRAPPGAPPRRGSPPRPSR